MATNEVQAEPMVTAAEIARLLGVDAATVRRWAEAAVIPAYKLRGTWRFRVSEVEAWARAQGTGQLATAAEG